MHKGLCVYTPDTSNNQNVQYSAVQLPSGLRIGVLVCLWWVKTPVHIYTPFIDNITPWCTQSDFGSHSKIISANGVYAANQLFLREPVGAGV